MAVAAIKPKNAVESLRDIVQDLLVPELKSIKVEIEGLRTEMRLRDEKQTHVNNSLRSEFDSFRGEVRLSHDSLRNELKSRLDSLRTEMQIRDDKQTASNQALSDKLGLLIEVRERLAVLEDRAKRA